MDIMNAFAEDMFGRIIAEAARLCNRTNKKTLTSREVTQRLPVFDVLVPDGTLLNDVCVSCQLDP
jgi:hypothetical protein